MKKVFLILPLLIIAIGLSFLFKAQVPKSSQVTNNEPPSSSSTPVSNPQIDILMAGGSSYLDPQGLYSFLYPNDYVLDTNDPKHPRIYKRGETQRPQGEMSDGILVVFESIDLGSQKLEQWVDNHIKQITADGTNEIVKNKEATTLNNFPGFTYEVKGLGTSTYLVLQKTAQSPSAVVIAYSISDPTSKNYQNELGAILTTFQILK